MPAPEIVNLLETQAYKYGTLKVAGFAPALTLFVIPNPGSTPKVFACYATPAAADAMAACEASIATVKVVGEPQPYQLTPEPKYAAKISAAIGVLDGLRNRLKGELHPDVTVARADELASTLAADPSTLPKDRMEGTPSTVKVTLPFPLSDSSKAVVRLA